MKRGVVTVNSQELDLLRHTPNIGEAIKSKIGSINSSQNLQLNSEQIETILDSLPAPDPNQPAIVSLRYKLNLIINPNPKK